ncbi:MAG: DNA polymerase III subunit chi [Arenicellales bacterium]
MTLERVDFYLLNECVPDGKLRAACRIARKALAQGYTTYVQTEDAAQAERLDNLMWTFDQGSFVPHRRSDDGGDPAPVLIGCAPPEGSPPHVLLSLGRELPPHFDIYQRIAEVVDNTGPDKELARRRYKAYQDRGCQLETHHISP